jgi:hypothetical protein
VGRHDPQGPLRPTDLRMTTEDQIHAFGLGTLGAVELLTRLGGS